MTRAEFLDKLEYEGEAYAFQEYGMSEDMLDEEWQGTPFATAVANARKAYQEAKVMGARLYFA